VLKITQSKSYLKNVILISGSFIATSNLIPVKREELHFYGYQKPEVKFSKISMKRQRELIWFLYGSEGIPLYQQRLVYNGKLLDDKRKLSDYHILEGAVIIFVWRLIRRPPPESELK
jgi:ubiquitin